MILDEKIEEILARAKNIDDVNNSSSTSPINNTNNLNVNIQTTGNPLLYCCAFICFAVMILAFVFF